MRVEEVEMTNPPVFRLVDATARYRAAAEFSDGVLVIRWLTVEAPEDTGNVTGAVLRAVPVAEIRQAITDYIRDAPRLIGKTGREWTLFPFSFPVVDSGDQPRRLDDGFLRSVAVAYLNTLHVEPRRVIATLAEQFQEPRAKVASWVARARREGWLTAAVAGRSGAKPGPRLTEWMKENPQ